MYHIVCPAKYRRKIFIEEVEKTLKEVCEGISERYEIFFVEIGADKDNVHFLVQSVPMITYGVLDSDRLPTKFSVLLDDFVSTSKAKIISKPYTVVKSGKVAKVSSGSVYYLILTSNSSYASTQNLEKVETGTDMEITPTVLDNNLVSMDININDSYLTGSPMAGIADLF